jgi:general secretion pathway protein K
LQGGVTAAGFLLVGAKRDVEEVDGLTLRFRAGTVRLTAADESGRINLNLAPIDLLAGLYSASGGTSLDPVSFAGRVEDWRDYNAEPSVGGAEAGDYESEGLSYRPANRPFRSVAELRLLLGLSRSDFNRLAPLLTVHSGQATIDPMSASPAVLRAIPNIQRSEVEGLMGARRNGATREQISALLARHAQYFSSAASGAYRVGAQARLDNGFSGAVEAVIVTPQSGDPADYHVVAWSRLPDEARPR